MANNSAEHRTDKDYVPFGDEWEKEMSKFAKPQLISRLGSAYEKNQTLTAELARVTKLLEEQFKRATRNDGHPPYIDKAWNDYKTKNAIR